VAVFDLAAYIVFPVQRIDWVECTLQVVSANDIKTKKAKELINKDNIILYNQY